MSLGPAVRSAVGRHTAAVLVAAGAVLALPAAPVMAQNPGSEAWRPAVRDGFGDPRTTGVEELEAMAGRLFAATRRRPGAGAAGVWVTDGRSGWATVPFDPPLPSTAAAVPAMTSDGAGELVVGTQDTAGGALHRLDGAVLRRWSAWQGAPGTSVAPGPLLTGEHVYFGTEQRSGAALWRVSRTSGIPERVLDFSRIDPTIDLVGGVASFKARLYAGTRSTQPDRAALWSSATGAPGTWRRVSASRRGFAALHGGQSAGIEQVGVAFGVLGDELFVGLANRERGGLVLTTADGRDWRIAMTAGVDVVGNEALVGYQPFEGALWMSSVASRPASAMVFDVSHQPGIGTSFGRMSEAGFGDPATRGGSPDLAVFDGALWWGGANARTGAQVWRLAADDLRRALATGPGVELPRRPLRLDASGRLPVPVTCPMEDPGGCHGQLEVHTQRRFGDGRRRQRIFVGGEIYTIAPGRTRTYRLRLPRALVRFLRTRTPMRLDVRAVAFDNARNARATLLLRR